MSMTFTKIYRDMSMKLIDVYVSDECMDVGFYNHGDGWVVRSIHGSTDTPFRKFFNEMY